MPELIPEFNYYQAADTLNVGYHQGSYITTADLGGTTEILSMLIATAAIALGLEESEVAEFQSRAYSAGRGYPATVKYEQLIKLAYEIRGRRE
jgi:hypothetical protein